MTYNPHTDLTSFLSTKDDVYQQLREDQTRDSRRHEVAKIALIVLTSLAALGWQGRWSMSPWLTVAAVIALERTIWWGRELSVRNHLMHTLKFESLPRKDL